jgi:guanine nucleotide-binding protein alpha-1 subunit
MDVKAIIFLAPVSVFDEWLEGDPGINQLEDSLNLWTAVCKSKLLGKVKFHHALFPRFRTAITDRN